jgi:diaminopimelate decarboxylase
MKGTFPIDKFERVQTPFYYYDTKLLRRTLQAINAEISKHEGFVVHYAIKANANAKLLRIIQEAGLGADCVSGGEIETAVKSGFHSSKIVFAGVGKSDW